MINELKALATEYAKTEEGAWLDEFDWASTPVRFKVITSDTMGYHFLGHITLREVVDISLIFDIYIHELRHVWQFKKHPVMYLIGKIFRPLIENDADAEEAKALKWFEEYRRNN
jgi:hypothetical protein